MKYDILHVFRTSTAFKEKSSYDFKDIYKLKLLTNFDVNAGFLPVMENLETWKMVQRHEKPGKHMEFNFS